MADYKQAGRPIRVTTPLGADVLLLQRVVGDETVSKPFELTLDMYALDSAVDPTKLLRKPITVEMDVLGGSTRYLSGIVRRFVQLGQAEKLTTYRAEVVPSAWLLSLSADCRVFQSKSVPDIVKQILDEFGIKDYKFNLQGTYNPREYCVQYRETHLAFVSRLLEEEGISYYFEHASGKHTMTFVDAPASLKPGPLTSVSMSFMNIATPTPNSILELEVGTSVTSGKVTLNDYNDTMPSTKLESTTAAVTTNAVSNARVYDYPGKFAVKADADRASRLLMEELEAMTAQVHGRTNSMGFASGTKAKIQGHYRSDVNQEYLVLTVHHDGEVLDYVTHSGAPFSYEGTFSGIPSSVAYRPPRITPRSIVHGSQTAVVVGPSGEEIYVDKYGRVKVQFFWDQLGTSDEKSSCWVRVSSSWAGKQWGFIQIPRIGQEVIVDFLEGDPDRPIITGRVYNADLMPPYTLPANGTQSGLKTRSSKQGATADFNEFRFEDKKGSEEVYLYSRKDFNVVTQNNETWKVVDGGRTTSIKMNDATEITDGDQSLKVTKGSETITIHKDRTTTIETGAEALTVKQGAMTTEVTQGDHTVLVKTGKMVTEVDTGDQTNTVKTGNQTNEVKTGNVATTVSMGNSTTDVKMGNISIKADMGKITIEAMQGIDLKVGTSTISITPAGINVKSTMVSMQGQATAELKSPMTTVNADGMLTLKGGITMIN